MLTSVKGNTERESMDPLKGERVREWNKRGGPHGAAGGQMDGELVGAQQACRSLPRS